MSLQHSFAAAARRPRTGHRFLKSVLTPYSQLVACGLTGASRAETGPDS